MNVLYEVYWEVDGMSGHSFIDAKDVKDALYIFERDFGRFGYKLISLYKN